MSSEFPHGRWRTPLLVVLACTAALSLQPLIAPHLWDLAYNAIGDGDDEEAPLMEEMEMEDQFHRILAPTVEEIFGSDDEKVLAIPKEGSLESGDNGRASESIPSGTIATSYAQLIDANQPLPPYTIEDAIESSKLYDHNFALLVYDPDDDAFYGLYSKRHYWVTGCQKLLKSFKYLAFFLRKLFPERFQGRKGQELIIPISSGDYLGVRPICVTHFHPELPNPFASAKGCSHKTAPVLHFGSVFRHSRAFPNIIAMPMPAPHHLACFEYWASRKLVCSKLQAELFVRKWEDLIPQVAWRGTDFTYLAKLQHSFKKPDFKESLISWPWTHTEKDKTSKRIGALSAYDATTTERKLDLRKRSNKEANDFERALTGISKAAGVEALKGQYEQLLPRWKAVVLTAEAEVEAAAEAQPGEPATLPWANMKFSAYMHEGVKTDSRGADEYKDWEDIGIATGEPMSELTLSKYKYQIDLGGGGGTTWSGTVQKLAMPGLLFRHMTPTKDYIHDWMKPWVHYVPVSSDLSDLKEKFDWAESHPVQAKKIADEGTALMKYLTSPEGFEQMFQQDMVEPLRRVIEAYQPVSSIDSQTWREAIRKIERDMIFSLIKCEGTSVHDGEQLLESKYMQSTLTRTAAHSFGVPSQLPQPTVDEYSFS